MGLNEIKKQCLPGANCKYLSPGVTHPWEQKIKKSVESINAFEISSGQTT
jgi:hypothetical protein